MRATMKPSRKGGRDKVTVEIGLTPEHGGVITTDGLAEEFQVAMSNKEDREALKTSIQITMLS